MLEIPQPFIFDEKNSVPGLFGDNQIMGGGHFEMGPKKNQDNNSSFVITVYVDIYSAAVW